MGNVEENRRRLVSLLDTNEYAIDEADGLILASKYCKRVGGGVICYLVEAAPPFERLNAWGGDESALDTEITRIVAELNEELGLLLGR